MHKPSAILLLNVAHAVDHMFLLIFATAVATIAAEFGFARWEDLMPFGVGAFVMFGLGSLPAGRLGDLWGRRAMMVVFFFGIGASSLLASLAQGPWQLAAALTLIGTFASIYHPGRHSHAAAGRGTPGRPHRRQRLVGNLASPCRRG
jgi:MFS family permease